ncbi:hypothetical protein C4D60_Mb06t25450 [Musa balbisiana]|uniref:Uncharacterized protein n=1 Tax=Musa balbisiana TaxID=52838 RepID=A0A4S8IRA8_MUSBA|nr:hypothetical protein C4D60_Mb06t25450 [Musa balbisiana]
MAGEKPISISSGFSDGETPSRCELLSMVKKHSNLLGDSVHDEQDASDVVMDNEFWHEVLDLYFIRGRVSKGREEDDLVFFVRKMNLHGHGFSDDVEDGSPFFVRRWAATLEKVVGEDSACVDWRRSFYLNLIAHTSYTVTVAICSKQDLEKRQSGQDISLSPIYKVVKTVYASPSRVDFQLDHKKAAETLPAYPNICFSVDDFDDTFDAVALGRGEARPERLANLPGGMLQTGVAWALARAQALGASSERLGKPRRPNQDFRSGLVLVLSERNHCYCVLLNAHGGPAFPTDEDLPECNSSRPVNVHKDVEEAKPSKLTLFSGFVSYQMVREAYDAGKSRFGSLLSMGHGHTKTDKIYMRGPGGRGEVEVAVSGIADQSHQNAALSSAVHLSRKGSGIGLGTIVHRAASAASVLAKHAYAATSPNKQSDGELLPLKCCLMSISLPWEYIAHDLLFKVSPPVDM